MAGALSPGTDIDVGRYLWLSGLRAGGIVAGELWDDDARYALAARRADVARTAGALVQLQYALSFVVWTHLDAGDLASGRVPSVRGLRTTPELPCARRFGTVSN